MGSIQKLNDASDFPMWQYQVNVCFRAAGLSEIVAGTEKLADCVDAAAGGSVESQRWQGA